MKIDASVLGIESLPRTLFLDTNVLLLYIIGLADRSAISRVRPTKNHFEPNDFDLLMMALSKFSKLRVTPNVLTEASDLLESRLTETLRSDVLEIMRDLFPQVDERYVPSVSASKVRSYLRVGLADSATILAGRENCLVMTDDLALYRALQEENVPTINFNHLRVA